MQQIAVQIPLPAVPAAAGRRRELVEQSQTTLDTYVSNGGLAMNLAQQPAAANMTVYPGGRAASFRFIGALKGFQALNFPKINAITIQNAEKGTSKLLALVALAAVPTCLVGCLCQLHWKRRVNAALLERDALQQQLQAVQREASFAAERYKQSAASKAQDNPWRLVGVLPDDKGQYQRGCLG
jgi:hypothetical protein